MKSKCRIQFLPIRFHFMIAIVIVAVLGLLLRLFDLAILNKSFLEQAGNERVLRQVSAPAFRGMILDRNHFPLAVSTSVYSVWINPQEFSPTKKESLALSKLLKFPSNALDKLIKKYHSREFAYLKRGIAPNIATAIKELDLTGVYLQKEYKRFYPEGEVTAHVVGFTNVDDQGQEGIELAYNQWLRGEPGKKWVIKDRLGRVISDVQTVQAQKPGKDIVLSIDRRIQYLAYRELLTGVKNKQADSGSVVVLDVATGEVLAMVNYPAYNPNNRESRKPDRIRNRAVTDVFEPGSTIKAFSMAAALESKRYTPDSTVDTSPGWLKFNKKIYRDPKNYGVMSMTQILQKSSNVGMAKIALGLEPNHLWEMFHRLGFGEITGISFPGEQSGSLVQRYPWGALTLASLAYGYGLSTSTIQLARAYAVLAHQGIKLPVTLLQAETPPTGTEVMEAKVAQEVLSLLEAVVQGGTGEKGKVPGYRVAGKTGTAWKVGKRGYEKHLYTSSFVGIAPLSNPRFVVAVVIQNPKGKDYLGGSTAGPVFERIMEGTLHIADVAPDA